MFTHFQQSNDTDWVTVEHLKIYCGLVDGKTETVRRTDRQNCHQTDGKKKIQTDSRTKE